MGFGFEVTLHVINFGIEVLDFGFEVTLHVIMS